MPERLLHGWGRTAPTRADVVRPESVDDVVGWVRAARAGGSPAGLLARGQGRSYGDAAQRAGGTVMSSAGLDHVGDVRGDGTAAEIEVGAGVRLDDLLRRLVPQGWWLPVVPGTSAVSVGGAVAADVHGKSHHADGAFGRHVTTLELVDGHGVRRHLRPGEAAFDATTGGMGLTGVVTGATLRLRPVRSAWMRTRTVVADDLDHLMGALADADRDHRYTVAWIDALTRGRHLGRGVVSAGEHAEPDELSRRHRRDPLRQRPPARLDVPVVAPPHLLNTASVAAFNEGWFRLSRATAGGGVQPLAGFFHPLDGVRHWNRMYGPRGFVQYQLAVPHEAGEVVRAAVQRLAERRVPSFLAVLKRFGAAGPGPLSFPAPGWTLALDLPADVEELGPLLDDLDERVAAAGGRVYLAKDARLRPDLLAAMYPRIAQWRTVRHELDPDGVFASDLSRRLGL